MRTRPPAGRSARKTRTPARPAAKPLGKKAQSERTRARILSASLHLFSRRGFAATSMADIAAAVEMTSGVLYWHFRSKEDLLIAVVEDVMRRFTSELPAVLGDTARGRVRPPASPFGTLASAVEQLLARNPEYAIFVAVLGAEAPDMSPRIGEALRAAYRRLADLVTMMLAQAVPEWTRDAGDDFACAAQLLMGMYLGGLLQQRLFRHDYPIERALPILSRLVWGAAHAPRLPR